MRLKQLLVVGKSIAGARPDKSPYAMRPDSLLPTFEGSPRFAHKRRSDEPGEPAMVQGELLAKPMAPGPLAHETPSSPFAAANTVSISEKYPEPSSALRASAPEQSKSQGTPPVKRRRSWLDFIGRKLFGRSGRRSDLVQSELTLDNIRVLRNDLEDSDLELVMKKKKRARKPGSEPARPGQPPATRPARTSSWNELTARLFEIGQQ
jgi:hypothetical protein